MALERSPFPFSFDLSCGGYRISGTRSDRDLDVYRNGWCGWIHLDRGQVDRISVTVPKWAPRFPREEAVKVLRRILGTPDEASQL